MTIENFRKNGNQYFWRKIDHYLFSIIRLQNNATVGSKNISLLWPTKWTQYFITDICASMYTLSKETTMCKSNPYSNTIWTKPISEKMNTNYSSKELLTNFWDSCESQMEPLVEDILSPVVVRPGSCNGCIMAAYLTNLYLQQNPMQDRYIAIA